MYLFGGFGDNPERERSYPSKLLRFLIFLQKIFVWTHEPPIGDLGGHGFSLAALKW